MPVTSSCFVLYKYHLYDLEYKLPLDLTNDLEVDGSNLIGIKFFDFLKNWN